MNPKLVRLFLLFVFLLVAVSLFTPPAQASGTFTVNSTLDEPDANPGDGVCASTPSGVCTLRAAIMETNAQSGASTISLPAGTYALTLEGADEDNAAMGDLDLKQAVTITGAGASSTIIDAVYLDRIFEVMSGVNATITAVTITRGTAIGEGSGIRNLGTLALDNVTFDSNQNYEAITDGGAIFNRGQLTITNSTFTGNDASAGSGIYNAGTLALSDSTLSDGLGVAISIAAGASTRLNNVQILYTDNPGLQGGGIYNASSNPAQLNDVLIDHNSADQGGGIYNAKGAALRVVNSLVTGNVADGEGGGIYNLGDLAVTGGFIGVNDADFGHGGGIFNKGKLTLNRVVLHLNSAGEVEFTPHSEGGGLYNDAGGSATLTNDVFDGNMATAGGGVSNNATAIFTNVTLVNNTKGGITGHVGATTRLKNTILSGNVGGNCAGQLRSDSHNLSSDQSCLRAFNSAGDFNNKDPRLGPVDPNDIYSPRYGLLSNSPAIDRGMNSGCPTTDYRGFGRPVDGNNDGIKTCDIGAFEYKAKSPGSSVCDDKPSATDLIAPADKSTAPQPALLQWWYVGCATRYEVIVRKGSASGPTVAHQAQLKDAQYTFTKPTKTGTYYWRVRACDQFGCSPWTPWWSFK